MIETTGNSYLSSNYAKALMASVAKVGKTSMLTGQLLGVFPWQKNGGVVTSPKHLHVMTFDANALGGVKRFLLETCKAPAEALDFRVYNLQDDLRQISLSEHEYDATFYGAIMTTLDKIRERVQAEPGVHAVVLSSLTGLAAGVERGIVGPPNGRGYSDPSKWKMLSHQLNEIRNTAQVDIFHCLWEAHVDKAPSLGMGKDEAPPKETIHVSGQTGRNFAYNVEQVFRIQRQIGEKYKDTQCDLMYLDTRPAMDFIANGRGFNEALAPKEYCLVNTFQKLGLRIGGWGRK